MNNAKRKILYVITQGGIWGGAQRYVFDLTTHLPPEYEVVVAIGEKAGNHDLQHKIEDLGGKVKLIQLDHLKRSISPLNDLLAVQELKKVYRQEKPDIAHLNSPKAGIIGVLAAKLIGKKPLLVYTAHGWVFNEPLSTARKSIYRHLEKTTAHWVDDLIVLANADETVARQSLLAPPSKTHLIRQGIDNNLNILTRAEAKGQLASITGADSKQIWIGVIANFFLTKGLDILIQAVGKNKDLFSGRQIIILGDGRERKNLENLINNFQLQNIVFLAGQQENAEKYLSAFDVLAIPSRKEGMPYVFLEALRQGLPIIATKVGGIPEIMDENLVEPGDDDSLVKEIDRVLSLDLEERQLISERNKLRSEEFKMQTMLEETQKLYKKAG